MVIDIIKNIEINNENFLLVLENLSKINVFVGEEIQYISNELEKMLSGECIHINTLGYDQVNLLRLHSELFYRQNTKIILISDIESGIYYKKWDLIIKEIDFMSSSTNIQFFITTHSNDFITRLDKFTDVSLHRINKTFDNGVMSWDRDKFIPYLEEVRHGRMDIR
jgi:AAA15 family ATPase/GTPase